MHRTIGRAAAPPALLVTAIAGAHSADASTPALIWRDVSAIGVQCVVQSDARGYDAALSAALCGRVRALAARSAPAPVKVIALGDPALLASGTVALLVHASVQSSGGGSLLAFSIRPFRASGEGSELLFGAAPRAVALGSSDSLTPAVDAALAEALGQTLPWQHRPDGPRPIATR